MPYAYSHCPAVAFYSNVASLCLISPTDTLYQIWIYPILRATMLLNTTMCVHTSHAPLLSWYPSSAVRSQHSVPLLTGQCCNSNSNTAKPHRPAVPTGQPHLDLVLVNHSRQLMQARLYTWLWEYQHALATIMFGICSDLVAWKIIVVMHG